MKQFIKRFKFYGSRRLNTKCNGLGIYYQFSNPYYYYIDFYLLIWRCSVSYKPNKQRSNV